MPRDSSQPPGQAAAVWIKGFAPAPGRNEDLLRDVLSVGLAAERSQRDREDQRGEPVVDARKGVSMALVEGRGDVRVGVRDPEQGALLAGELNNQN
jgi:hypothetical protein